MSAERPGELDGQPTPGAVRAIPFFERSGSDVLVCVDCRGSMRRIEDKDFAPRTIIRCPHCKLPSRVPADDA
jgi:hypothetical protein